MEEQQPNFIPHQSYLRIATACPEVSVADVPANIGHIQQLYSDAVANDVSLVTFPELSVTGYTLGDLVNQTDLLDRALDGVLELADTTKDKPTAMVVGLPIQVGNKLYNCAAVIANGEVQGIVPKQNTPTYNEFYEARWFSTWDPNDGNVPVALGDRSVPFGSDLLFEIGDVPCGVEICEDLWVLNSPSNKLATQGALVIANPSASPEQVTKAGYRHNLVSVQSAKMIGAYAYAGCHPSESTAEVVMGGHQLIYENGQKLAERKPFGKGNLLITDVDIDHLRRDRRVQHMAQAAGALTIRTGIKRQQTDLRDYVEPDPFLPGGEAAADRAERLEAVLDIQAQGLAQYMMSIGSKRLVLGLSGGLDSTLALLVAHRAAGTMELDQYDTIHTLTMPGPASSDGTQSNAQILAKELGVRNEVIPIETVVNAELDLLQHDSEAQDVTYENTQARARTSLLFNYGNMHNAVLLGTGDLSEIFLGWSTYNGDQQSHYNVNASIPKTLVRHLVQHVADQPEYAKARPTLEAILNTVISPELTKAEGDAISQSTEELIGPYRRHEFYMHRKIRWGDSSPKILYLAERAFEGTYGHDEIHKWLDTLSPRRFMTSQIKRTNMPSGPKVGSVSLSPRGDWRMPPDLQNPAIWDVKA